MRSHALGRRWVCAVAGLLGLAGTGCLGGSLLASSRSTTHIESVPSGAQVFVMGERVGITPLDVEDRLVFPVDFPREKADLYGKILLRKESCDDLLRPLSLQAANQGLTVELRCASDPFVLGPSGSESAAAGGFEARSDESARAASLSLDERLSEIEELWTLGLVDAEEYELLRERVLRETVTAEAAVEALHRIEALRAAGSIEEAEFQRLRQVILEGL